MDKLTEFIVHFGDIVELNFPQWNCVASTEILLKHPGWQHYNPRKPINRKGLSVTSLDGGYSGIPDLDSLNEYNRLHNTNYTDTDFKNRTSIVNHIPELNYMLDIFPDHGRCHFLRLDSGGFFPPHRDNGLASTNPFTFRLLVPICNFDKYNLVWIQEDKILKFEHGITYFINTTKVHHLFSFIDMCCCFVMNIKVTSNSIQTLLNYLKIT